MLSLVTSDTCVSRELQGWRLSCFVLSLKMETPGHTEGEITHLASHRIISSSTTLSYPNLQILPVAGMGLFVICPKCPKLVYVYILTKGFPNTTKPPTQCSSRCVDRDYELRLFILFQHKRKRKDR